MSTSGVSANSAIAQQLAITNQQMSAVINASAARGDAKAQAAVQASVEAEANGANSAQSAMSSGVDTLA
jgi:hypothetical protein